MTLELRARGFAVNHQRLEPLNRAFEMPGLYKPFKVRTTIPAQDNPEVPDLAKREFAPGAPNQVWVGDISYIPTGEGWLYLASVIDLGSRRGLGYAMADHMRTELVIDALDMAANERRGATDGIIFHGDRGSQGGFNWSSQHLDREVSDGQASGVDDGVDGAVSYEVAGSAVASSGGGASVLARDRDRRDKRGGRCRGRGVPGRGKPLVPAWWRDFTDESGRAHWPLSVVRRA